MIFSSLLFIVAAVSTSSARMIVSNPQPRKTFGRPVKYAAEDVSDFFMPGPVIRPHFPPPFLASDAENLQNGGINLGEITRIAGQINEIGHILGFDADDLEDGDYDAMIDVACKVISTICKVADTGFKVHDTAKKSRGSDLPDLSFDAEDAEDFPIIPACAIIGAGCAIIDTGLNIYDHIKGDDESEELSNMYIPPSSVPLPSNFPGGFNPIYLDAEDLHNGINWGDITKITGHINRIGQAFVYSADDADNKFNIGSAIRAHRKYSRAKSNEHHKGQQFNTDDEWYCTRDSCGMPFCYPKHSFKSLIKRTK